jgi:hypothetical protein
MPTTTVQFPLPQFHYKKVKPSNCNPQKISDAAWNFFNKASPQMKAVYMKIGGPAKLNAVVFAIVNPYLPLIAIAQAAWAALLAMHPPTLSKPEQDSALYIVMGVLNSLA